MLFKVSCVAIVIAIACFQMGYAAPKLETETETNSETETKLKDESTTADRSKRALYYQNDLISNQERQLRSLLPLGGAVYPAYDYLYGGLPVYDYLYYDYLNALYPVYPIVDYYDYLYPDYLFPLSAKVPATGAAGATHNLAAARRGHGSQPLAGGMHRHHNGGGLHATEWMAPQHLQQHQQFGAHAPHAFGKAAVGPSPLAPSLAPPQSAAFLQPFEQQQQAQAVRQQHQRYQDQFNAIKLASSKGSTRNY